jgi:hypothetical protein
LTADSLLEAERIARSRNVNLSTVVAEALENGLQIPEAAERAEQVLSAYKKAFTGFSDEQSLLLDGVVLEPAGGRDRR